MTLLYLFAAVLTRVGTRRGCKVRASVHHFVLDPRALFESHKSRFFSTIAPASVETAMRDPSYASSLKLRTRGVSPFSGTAQVVRQPENLSLFFSRYFCVGLCYPRPGNQTTSGGIAYQTHVLKVDISTTLAQV